MEENNPPRIPARLLSLVLVGLALGVVACTHAARPNQTVTPSLTDRPTPTPLGLRGDLIVLDESNNLLAVHPDGSGLNLLASGVTMVRPRLSPDLTSFVGQCPSPGVTGGGWRACLMNVDGSGLTTLAPGTGPSWSPDGQWIAWSDSPQIYLARKDGTDVQTVALVSGASSPTWASDSKHLYVLGAPALGMSGKSQLVVIDAQPPHKVASLQFDAVHLHPFTLSPAGAQVAYINFDVQVVISQLDGSRPTVVSAGQQLVYFASLLWSPDGRRLAFLVRDGDSVRLAVVNADGTALHLLGRFQTQVVASEGWSPDGAYVAVSWVEPSTAGGSGRLTVLSADGQSPELTFDSGVQQGAVPSLWWPDSRGIYFVGRGDDFRGEVVRRNHLISVSLDRTERRLTDAFVAEIEGIIP